MRRRFGIYCALFLGVALGPVFAHAATGSISSNHVNGNVIVGYNSNTCNGTIAGAVRYNSATGVVDFCNGTNWLSTMVSLDSVVSNCVAANKGALRFSSLGVTTGTTISSYLEVCDGTSWSTIGPSANAAGSNQQIQYNSSGLIGADSNLTWNSSTGNLNVGGSYLIGGYNGLAMSASGNPVIGRTAMSTTLAPLSVAVGRDALSSVTGEASSVAVGYQALKSTTSGVRNTAVGQSALYSNTTGSDNTAAGNRALYNNTTGNENTAIGADAMGCVIGIGATGSNNTAIGSSALCNNSSGNDNVAAGRRALYSNTTGSYNTAVGVLALASNTSGNYNTAMGWSALALSTGNYNIGYGYNAGSNLTSGDNNIAIGYNVTFASATGSNQLNIGNLIYGDLSAGNVAIGTSSFTGKFMVTPPSTETITAAATITASCGTVKTITAASPITTNTTNTFTLPGVAKAGCCMDVINVGANTITLSRNANFLTATGANLSLAANNAVRVCSRGISSTWIQMAPLSANN